MLNYFILLTIAKMNNTIIEIQDKLKLTHYMKFGNFYK